jgi:hypothetical protein
MPDGKTHKLVGAGTGAVYAAYRAKEETNLHWWMEVAGGAFGGYLGGACPDVLEPAISSWHRGTAHSYATGGGIVALKNGLKAFAEACRENAEKCKAIDMIWDGNIFIPAIPDPISLVVSKLFDLMWRFLAGFVNGFAAGYVSHLTLDATIGKRSIPLLRRGF